MIDKQEFLKKLWPYIRSVEMVQDVYVLIVSATAPVAIVQQYPNYCYFKLSGELIANIDELYADVEYGITPDEWDKLLEWWDKQSKAAQP